MSPVYDDLGLTPVINAAGSVSRLGGTRLSEPVRAAMAAAARDFVPLDELQQRASQAIAAATGAEAGYVAGGAAACLYLAAAAGMTRGDLAAMARLPHTTGIADEIVVHRAHRNAYDVAIRATGARFVEVGYLGPASGVGTHAWELEAAMTERTAAVAYPASNATGVLPLTAVAGIAHRRGLPVITDAAESLPPPGNLRRFIHEGADLVVYSGGKAIGGPAASGFVCGRRDLILQVALLQQDMYVRPETWEGVLGTAFPEPPHQGIGRMLKVGREEIVGLIVALGCYLARDHDADQARWRRTVDAVAAALAGGAGLAVRILEPPARSVPQVVVRLDGADGIERAASAVRALRRGDPRVFVGEELLGDAALVVNPMHLEDEEVGPLAQRLSSVLCAR